MGRIKASMTGKNRPASPDSGFWGSIRAFAQALRRERVPLLVGLMLCVVGLGALGFFLTEQRSALAGLSSPDKVVTSLWWSFVTIATVGYGDVVPKTILGRAMSVGVIFSGVVMMSVITATIASVMVERRIKEDKGLEVVKFRGHMIIAGYNPTLEDILMGIQSGGGDREVVLINELEEDQFAQLKFKFRGSLDLRFVHGDYTSEAVLKRAGVDRAASVLVLSDTSGGTVVEKADERVILGVLAIKSLSPKVRVSAEILERANISHLRRARADEVIVRGEYSGYFLASSILAPGISQVMRQLMTYGTGLELSRRAIPADFVGRSFEELSVHFRSQRRAILIGVLAEAKGLDLDEVLAGDTSIIDNFIKQKFEEAGEGVMGGEQVRITLSPPDDYVISAEEVAILIEPEEA